MDKYDGITIVQHIILHVCTINMYLFLPHLYMPLLVRVYIFYIENN